MAEIHSQVTELPSSCKSAAEHMVAELEREEQYAGLNENCCRRITELEQAIAKETGERVALVAYRL
ncbi:MAG: hypothetical protein HFI63_04300 [Lachnospiraceae bacterium]|nr:hypothetical protein [Lachnospiraceae bacterium]